MRTLPLLSSRNEVRTLALIGLAALAILGLLFAVNVHVIRNVGGGGEFLVLWAGLRGIYFEQTDPYSGTVASEVQHLVYDRPARYGEQPYILDVPFHLLILLSPFALIPVPDLALAAFTVLLELALLGTGILSAELAGWRRAPVAAVVFTAALVLNPYALAALAEASPTLLLGFAFVAIARSLSTARFEVAGMLIVLSTFSWEVGAPVMLFFLARSIHFGRGRVWVAGAMLLLVLLAISQLIYPGWYLPFLRAVVNNVRATYGLSMADIATHWRLPLGQQLRWVAAGLAIVLMGFEWPAVASTNPRWFAFAACVVAAATPLLGQRLELEHLAPLLFPWAVIVQSVGERWERHRPWPVLALLAVLMGLAWWFAIRTSLVAGLISGELMFLYLPVTTLLALYWMRWWAVRPPRTWADSLPRRGVGSRA